VIFRGQEGGYPPVPRTEIFAEAVEKKETSKFLRNRANWMSLIPFLDISAGRVLFGSPPPAMLLVWGHGVQLVKAAKEMDIKVSVWINMAG